MKNRLVIFKQNIEGKAMWCVQRLDGEPLNSDGIVSYNFDLDDWQKAIDCRLQLEKQ